MVVVMKNARAQIVFFMLLVSFVLLLGCVAGGPSPAPAEKNKSVNVSVPGKQYAKPIATVKIGKTTFTVGEEVSFEGEGVADEGSITAYSWRSGASGQLSAEKSFSTSALSAGTHEIFFKVQDGRGQWSDDARVEIRVLPVNKKPVALVNYVSGYSIAKGDSVEFIGHGEDADGSVVAFEWNSTDGVLSTKASFNTTALPVGVNAVEFRVKDNRNEWSEPAQVKINVSDAGKPPKARITVIDPNPSVAGALVMLGGVGVDSGSKMVEYYWESDKDGSLRKLQKIDVYLSVGAHIIRFKVKNDKGAWSGFDEKIANVYSSRIDVPRPRINSITPSSAKKGASVYFNANAYDIDGNIMAYEWRSSIDGPLSTQPSFTTAALSVGRHYVYVRAKDNSNNWSPEVAAIVDVTE